MQPEAILPSLSPRELSQLRHAKALLENPGLAARLANTLGAPIERGFQRLPPNWSKIVQRASRLALTKALGFAVGTIDAKGRGRASNRFHQILVGASGGIGGAFGLPALPIELPISTTLMLRSIADIARSEGHRLQSLQTRMTCLEVFALGGRTPEDDAAENAYWTVRAALAAAISEATAFIAQRAAVEESAPAIARLIGIISSRFGTVVSEQIAAKAVPMIGAATGALINLVFMDHFQQMARGHFIVKRLEAKYGSDPIKTIYASFPQRIQTPAKPS